MVTTVIIVTICTVVLWVYRDVSDESGEKLECVTVARSAEKYFAESYKFVYVYNER
jgi:hypothetical protein